MSDRVGDIGARIETRIQSKIENRRIMLLENQPMEEEAQAAILATPTLKYQPTLLPELTNDELLDQLRELAVSHAKMRKGAVGIYFGGIAMTLLGILIPLIKFETTSPQLPLTPFIVAIFASVGFTAIGTFGAMGIGRSFFRGARGRLSEIIPALAQREEPRLLPMLLDFLDMRVGGNLIWEQSRPILLDAMEIMLSGMTDEQFQGLSRQQVWDIVLMLYFPDGKLRYVAAEALVRCGDTVTLEQLKKMQGLLTVSMTSPKSALTRWSPAMWWLKKQNVPMPTPEIGEIVDKAVADLSAIIEEGRRTAQLLRASDRNFGADADALVRAAAGPGVGKTNEELMRPAAGPEAPPSPTS